MRLIAITQPYFYAGEGDAVLRLLVSGWWRVHIRKPGADAASVARLLKSIPEEYHGALSLHDRFELVSDFAVGGVHLNGRNPVAPVGWKGLVSRSCHSLDEAALHRHLDYVTLSPIFDSISKPGYSGRFDLASLKGLDLGNVFALGGVTRDRLSAIEAAGFGGAAMLSQAWN